MGWIFLAVAVAADVAGTAAFQHAARCDLRRYLLMGAASYVVGFGAFARALQLIPTSIADAVFAAASTALVAALGVIWLGERLTVRTSAALVLVTVGVVVLHVEAGHG